MTLPVERYKDAYKNHRYNPFSGADMAIDKEEDHLFIPSGAPFLIQMLEQPRKNTPTSVSVYCYDDVASFTEVVTAPAQGEYRVDYPPTDGEGTGLIEFNQNDADKEVKVNYKATGSPNIAEFLDTKVSYPATVPNDHQVVGFVSGAPEWRYNPVCYFHEGPVLYHASGEDESCLHFLFKRSTKQATVILFLKGTKLHQGYYTELAAHLHSEGTLAGTQPTHTHGVVGNTAGAGENGDHTHGAGTLSADSGGSHDHGKGTLVGSQGAHHHVVDGDTGNNSVNHTHGLNNHTHAKGTLSPNANPGSGAVISGVTAGPSPTITTGVSEVHHHSLSFNSGDAGDDVVLVSGSTASGGGHGHGVSGETALGGAGGSHNHTIDLTSVAGGDDAVTVAGNTANAGGSPKTYPDQLKVYIAGTDRTAALLALSPLTQFGDGTSGHDFCVTGSGELNISTYITSAGFWEIKVTEPISAKGGGVLLHLEVY